MTVVLFGNLIWAGVIGFKKVKKKKKQWTDVFYCSAVKISYNPQVNPIHYGFGVGLYFDYGIRS